MTVVERLAAILRGEYHIDPVELARRLVSRGATLPPAAPELEATPAWVEEAARVLVDTWYPDKGKGEDVYAAVRALARLWGYDPQAARLPTRDDVLRALRAEGGR